MAMYDVHILTDAGVSPEHALAFVKWYEQACSALATKADLQILESKIGQRIADAMTANTRWMFGAMAAQTALIVGLVKLLH